MPPPARGESPLRLALFVASLSIRRSAGAAPFAIDLVRSANARSPPAAGIARHGGVFSAAPSVWHSRPRLCGSESALIRVHPRPYPLALTRVYSGTSTRPLLGAPRQSQSIQHEEMPCRR